MGNHDGWDEAGLKRWRETWKKQDYYSFTYGGVYFLALNSLFLQRPDDLPRETEAHESFITSELEAAKDNPHKFVFQHVPLYDKDPEEAAGSGTLPLPERR